MAFDFSIIPSIIGMGTTIGGAIPGLKKPKRTNAASEQVRRAQSAVAGAAVGGAQTGHGASKGLALREGIRGASKLVGDAAAAGAGAARADEDAFQGQLDARNQRIAALTGGIGEGLAQMTQGLITPKGNEAASAEMQGQPEMQGAQTATGLEGPAAGEAPSQQALASTTEGLQDPDGASLEQLEQEFADEGAGPTADFKSTKALEELLTAAPTTAAPALEADLENRLQAKALMLQDAERLGYSLDGILAQINRRFQLQPGQSVDNPLGVSLDHSGDE